MCIDSKPTMVRLDQLLVSRGWGSRKDVHKLIRRGRVRILDEVIRIPKFKLNAESDVWIDDQHSTPTPQLIMYHKPLHVLSTYRDPWGRAGLDTILPAQWRTLFHPVGRLDADTTGLLFFSRDGQITHKLLHPKNEIPRTYRAHVHAVPDHLTTTLAEGVQTALGNFKGQITQIQDHHVTLTVREGKHRMVRRMLHNAGASVLALHRLSFGNIDLGDVEEGQYRPLTKEECKDILKLSMSKKST